MISKEGLGFLLLGHRRKRAGSPIATATSPNSASPGGVKHPNPPPGGLRIHRCPLAFRRVALEGNASIALVGIEASYPQRRSLSVGASLIGLIDQLNWWIGAAHADQGPFPPVRKIFLYYSRPM